MKSILIPLSFIITFYALALPPIEQIQKYVPNGRILQTKEKEVKVLTPANTVVEIEFKRNGDFEEASGDNAEQDTFIPGQNLVSLKKAVDELKSKGKVLTGDWSLEHSFLNGWVYEFDGVAGTTKMDIYVDAKTGKFMKEKIDD